MLITAGGISLKGPRRNRWKSSSYIPFKMLHKRYRYLLIQDLKKRIKEYLEGHPEEKGELKVFKDPQVLDNFFDPYFKMKEKAKFINWRERQQAFTGRDPFLCPVCGKEMELIEIAYFSKEANGLVYRSPP